MRPAPWVAASLTFVLSGPLYAQEATPDASEEAVTQEESAPPQEVVTQEESPAQEEPPAPEEPPIQEEPAELPLPTQTPPPAAETEIPAAEDADTKAEGEEVIYITGSRIKRTDLATAAPITVLDRQQIDASGMVSIGEILQNLPSQSNAINVQFNNGGDGSTRVNLRGLGAGRTLVLVNGRRFVPGGIGANASVDLNSIPVEIIERVEVLKDGASAIYGSDAVGGVVNIITKKNFSGVEGTVYTGGSQHGGLISNISVTAGESTERAGILLSFSYFNQTELLAGKRDFSRSDLDFDWNGFCPAGDDGTVTCGGNEDNFVSTEGSTAPPQGLIVDTTGAPGNANWEATGALASNGVLFNDPQAGWRTANLGGNFDVGEGDFYNYQPENYLLTPSERYNVFGTGHFEINDYIRTTFEASYTNRQSDQLLAPTPLFIVTEQLTVDANNVYNPFGRDFSDVRRRMVEAGNRNFLQDLDTYRFSVGADGRLPDGLGALSTFRWDFSFVYGRTEGTNVNEGRFVRSRVANAIGPSFIDASGTPTCGTPSNPIAGCVPLNLFGAAGSISQGMLDYISYTGIDRGFSQQQLINFNMGGELFELWDRPVGLALGFQHRQEEGGYNPDPITASGDTTGNKQEPTGGGFTENAAFAELQVPILADLPGVDVLEVSAAARVFNFNSFGTDMAYKVGGRWQLMKHVALRGTVSRAFRAPSIGELFSGTADSFPTITDPCDTSQGARTPQQQANCSADGLSDNYQDSRTQLRSLVGGNPELDPETANIFTAGVVLTPKINKWTDGLSLTLDYFSIGIDNTITTVGSAIILNNCYGREQRSNCNQIVRAPNGFITVIQDTATNIGALDTAGVDASLAYQLKTDIGRWGFNFDATFTQSYEATFADRSTTEGVGVYDLGVFPRTRFNTALVWGLDSLSAGWNLRFIGGFEECQDNACNSTPEGEDTIETPQRRGVDANTTMDLWVSYALSTPIGFTTLTAGINNVTDQAPPRLYNGRLANSDASTYDFLGRFFYLSARHRF